MFITLSNTSKYLKICLSVRLSIWLFLPYSLIVVIIATNNYRLRETSNNETKLNRFAGIIHWKYECLTIINKRSFCTLCLEIVRFKFCSRNSTCSIWERGKKAARIKLKKKKIQFLRCMIIVKCFDQNNFKRYVKKQFILLHKLCVR